MRRSVSIPLSTSLLLFAGCHSHYIQATITNGSGATISVVQIDYPSASFGTQQLQPGAAFPYRFKLLGSGPIKLTFIDGKNQEHTQTGPYLNEGQEGRMEINIAPGNHADFVTSLKP